MLLAAEALGYSSCWYEGHITDEDRIGEKMAAVLGVPDGYELVCFLPVGIAQDEKKAPKRKPSGSALFTTPFRQRTEGGGAD